MVSAGPVGRLGHPEERHGLAIHTPGGTTSFVWQTNRAARGFPRL